MNVNTINGVWHLKNYSRGVQQYGVKSTVFELRTYIPFRHLYSMRQTLLCLQEVLVYFIFNKKYFYNNVVPLEFLLWEIRVAFLGESQLRRSRATQLTEHRTPTWTTESLTCAQMLMHAIAHWVVRTHYESLHRNFFKFFKSFLFPIS